MNKVEKYYMELENMGHMFNYPFPVTRVYGSKNEVECLSFHYKTELYDLSIRTIRLLSAAGIMTPCELRDTYLTNKLLKCRNLGEKSYMEIKEYLCREFLII